MKTVNFLQDIDNRVIVPMTIKAKFEHKGFNFAVVIEPAATHKYYTLINFENGGKLPMYKPTKKTIKDFVQKSIESIDSIIVNIGFEKFSETLKKHPQIN